MHAFGGLIVLLAIVFYLSLAIVLSDLFMDDVQSGRLW